MAALRGPIQTRVIPGEEWPWGSTKHIRPKPKPTLLPVSFPVPSSLKSDDPPGTRHRIVATPAVGRPIWEYRDERGLLKGLLCVLEAHQRLCNKGWLHGAVSPGNILLAIDDELANQAPGFMIDFDSECAPLYALVATKTIIPPQKVPRRWGPQGAVFAASANLTHTSYVNPHRTPSITRTSQFSSRRQLAMAVDPALNLALTPEDDVESLFLVLVYAVTRALACSDRMERLYSLSRRGSGLPAEEIQYRQQQLIAFFEKHWGETVSVQDLHQSRFDGTFFIELVRSDPWRAAGKVGKWFAAPGEPGLVPRCFLKGVLHRCVRKFGDSEVFGQGGSDEADSDADSDSDSEQINPNPPPPASAAPLGLTASKLFTHDEVIEMFKKTIAELERSEMKRKQSPRNRAATSKLAT